MKNEQSIALKNARKTVNALEFGTAKWESAMKVVRNLVAAQQAAEEFCSVDQGDFRTRLNDGRMIGRKS